MELLNRMMTRKHCPGILPYVMVGLFLCSAAAGEDYKKLATAGLKFLEIDASVRSAAMGGASNCFLDGAEALFQNPAGLSAVSGFSLTAGSNRWIADISQHTFAAAINLDLLGLSWLGGTLGASLRYTDNGDMQRTDFSQVTEDNLYYVHDEPYTIDEWAAGIAYSRKVTDQFTFGAHVKYAVQDLGEVTIWRYWEGDTAAVQNRLAPLVYDFGTIYNTGYKDLRIAMSFRNFAQELIYARDKFELPITMVIGTAVTVWGEPGADQSLLLSMDLSHPRDYTERICVGTEYRIGPMAIRGGYRFNHDEEGFSGGFGLNLAVGESRLQVDFAQTQFGVFGMVQRAAVGFSFK